MKESLKARGLSIEGKKEDMKLRFQQAVAAWVQNISEEEMQQLRNQMEGLHPETHWEELNNMDEPVDSIDDDEESRAHTVPGGEA